MNISYLEELDSHPNVPIIVTSSRLDSLAFRTVQAVAQATGLHHIVTIAYIVIKPMRDPLLDLELFSLDDIPEAKKPKPHSHLIAQQTSHLLKGLKSRSPGNKKQSTRQSDSKRGRRR